MEVTLQTLTALFPSMGASLRDNCKYQSTAREVVSRLLKKLEQAGAVRLTRNQVEIIDLQKILV